MRILRRLVLVAGLVVSAPVLLVLLLILSGNWLAEVAFDQAVALVPLGPNSRLIETQSEFGHLEGNGDHCDVRVVQLLESPASAAEVAAHDRPWVKAIQRSLHRGDTFVDVTDAEPGAAGRPHRLRVEWFSFGPDEDGLDTIDPRC